MNCETCDRDLNATGFAWTDLHGVARCCSCGTPYRIFHCEGDPPKRVDKPPESVVGVEYKALVRNYWQEFKRIIPSGCSFPGGQELASLGDAEHFHEWFTKAVDQSKLTANESEGA